MGGVPKQRHTKGHRNQRRMHIFVEAPAITKCPKCQKPVLPHTVCQNCGTYKGREVIDVLAKLTKKEKKQKEQEMKTQQKADLKNSQTGALKQKEEEKK
jgi:large subunit ribosomal protein L32